MSMDAQEKELNNIISENNSKRNLSKMQTS